MRLLGFTRRRGAGNPVPALAALCTVLVLGLGATDARADVTVRTLEEALDAGRFQSFGFQGSVGEVEVVGGDGDMLRATVELLCNREGDEACRRAAEEVDLRVRRRGDRVQLKIEDWPKLHNKRMSLRARLEVPRRLAVEVDMGVGEVTVRGTASHVEVDLGVGEIVIEVPEAAVRSIELDVGVGEAVLRTGERTIDGSGFVGSHLSWRDGPGRARIEADSGVGEIEVRLR